ncbi:MAG: hypothetical protein ACFFEK_15655 [Candidatus Thorarchaeota archaeon]
MQDIIYLQLIQNEKRQREGIKLMDDFGLENEDKGSDGQIRLQIIIGTIAVPLLIVSSVFVALGLSYMSWSDYRPLGDLCYLIGHLAGISGSAFLVVGTIAILKRNGSSLAWVLAAVYIFGWIWHYAYIYAIFPGVMGLENVNEIFVLQVIGYVRTYSIVAVLLYAWWSIHDTVSYRPVYYSYIIYIALDRIVSYIVTGLLFGFGSHQIWTPEEAFALYAPDIIISSIGYLILLLFFITQFIDHRRVIIEG